MGAARKLVPQDVYADLFCGGGGFSKGFALACADLGVTNIRLIAINHAQIAVDTHKANHPWAEHYCSRVDQLDVRKLVPGGRVKLLLASPECTNHANARGGRPINDQSRSTAWDVIKWAQELYVETILIENVREIMDWGPLGADGRPLKSKRGEIFAAWVEAISRCGYHVDHRILNAADFGAATTRKRFFLIARRANRKIVWPEPTHSKGAEKSGDLFRGLKPWRGAWEIIDWNKKGVDLFEREKHGLKPLRPNTIARIEAGARKFWGPVAEPFIIQLRGTSKEQVDGSAHSVKDPLHTITGGGIHAGLIQPFILGPRLFKHPYIDPVTDPLRSIRASTDNWQVVVPFVITPGGTDLGVGRKVKDPLPTVMTKERFAVVEPFIVGTGGPQGTAKPKGVKPPLGAVIGMNHRAIVEPFVVQVNHGTDRKSNNSGRVRSVSQPIGTITRENGHGLVCPFITKYYGSGSGAVGVKEPIPTLTGKERFALVTPVTVEIPKGYELRAYFRMFEDYELARAMGFEGYEFKGTKKDRILMIGNAVEVNVAKALCGAILAS